MRVRFLLVVTGLLVLAAASPAYAGGPTDIMVTPPGGARVVVSGDSQPDLFDTLNAVNYQAGLERGGGTPLLVGPFVPGPRYRVQVAYHQRPAYEYEWYPLSSDGPRIFVPQRQPGDYGMPGQPGWYASTEAMVLVLKHVEAMAAATATSSPPPEAAPASSSVSSSAQRPLWSIVLPAAAVLAVVGGLVLLSRRGWRITRAVSRSG